MLQRRQQRDIGEKSAVKIFQAVTILNLINNGLINRFQGAFKSSSFGKFREYPENFSALAVCAAGQVEPHAFRHHGINAAAFEGTGFFCNIA